MRTTPVSAHSVWATAQVPKTPGVQASAAPDGGYASRYFIRGKHEAVDSVSQPKPAQGSGQDSAQSRFANLSVGDTRHLPMDAAAVAMYQLVAHAERFGSSRSQIDAWA